MDILPRVNFYSSMIPLAPPLGYWNKLKSLVSKFIRKGKRPHLKHTTLQRDKSHGGLALPDLVYANVPLKKAELCLGPIISFLLISYRTVMTHVGTDYKWHNHTPIFNNLSFLTGNMPFSLPHWKNRGVNILIDLYNVHGLRAFNNLQAEFDVLSISFFLYMQSAMRAYGVPWGAALPTHPLRKPLVSVAPTREMVSKLPNSFLDPTNPYQ